MIIYGPYNHQLGELDYAWIEDNELHIRTPGGQVFSELYTTENIAAGELLLMKQAADRGARTYALRTEMDSPIRPVTT